MSDLEEYFNLNGISFKLSGDLKKARDLADAAFRLMFLTKLNNVNNLDQIWGDIFEGAWQDIFDIQINVAKQVAQKLKTVLSPEEVKRIETEPTNNVEAYNLYLQGRYLWHSISRDDKYF